MFRHWHRQSRRVAVAAGLLLTLFGLSACSRRKGSWAQSKAEYLIVEMLDKSSFRPTKAEALAALDLEGLRAIEDCLAHPEREAYHQVCVMALRFFTNPERFRILNKILATSDSAPLRRLVVSIVFECEELDAVIPMILLGMDDDDPAVKWNSVNAAMRYRLTEAIPKLEAILEMPKYKDDPNVEEHVVPALERLRDLE